MRMSLCNLVATGNGRRESTHAYFSLADDYDYLRLHVRVGCPRRLSNYPKSPRLAIYQGDAFTDVVNSAGQSGAAVQRIGIGHGPPRAYLACQRKGGR